MRYREHIQLYYSSSIHMHDQNTRYCITEYLGSLSRWPCCIACRRALPTANGFRIRRVHVYIRTRVQLYTSAVYILEYTSMATHSKAWTGIFFLKHFLRKYFLKITGRLVVVLVIYSLVVVQRSTLYWSWYW